MSWSRLFELFIIISLLVCAIKIESEKVKVEKGKEKGYGQTNGIQNGI